MDKKLRNFSLVQLFVTDCLLIRLDERWKLNKFWQKTRWQKVETLKNYKTLEVIFEVMSNIWWFRSFKAKF